MDFRRTSVVTHFLDRAGLHDTTVRGDTFVTAPQRRIARSPRRRKYNHSAIVGEWSIATTSRRRRRERNPWRSINTKQISYIAPRLRPRQQLQRLRHRSTPQLQPHSRKQHSSGERLLVDRKGRMAIDSETFRERSCAVRREWLTGPESVGGQNDTV